MFHPAPGTSVRPCLEMRVLAGVITVVTMRSYWVRVAPDAVTSVPQRLTHMGETAMWSQRQQHDASTSQGTPVSSCTRFGFRCQAGSGYVEKSEAYHSANQQGAKSTPSIPGPGIRVTKGSAREAHANRRSPLWRRWALSPRTMPLPTPRAARGRSPLPPGV